VTADVGELLRELAPKVLGALVRRFGDFAACEDAVQEALVTAAGKWPATGLPDDPTGWLVTVAGRRRIEMLRRDAARQRREQATATLAGPPPAPAASDDDTLTLLLLCCHPALTPPSQVALTLRAVGGLTTAEIARAFLVPEATIAQRISRAKKRIRDSGARFALPPADERARRIGAVLHVLYLVFTEGHTASSGDALHRVDLTAEAIRLTRQVKALVPDDGEVAGLLALMLLTDARRPARTAPDGSLVPLAEQDRTLWNRAAIAEGTSLVETALRTTPVGPYQIQAAIAALHDEATTADGTDWTEILGLYDLLAHLAPGPMITLNRIVALAMVRGPEAGLRSLAEAETDPALAGHHRTEAVRAHLLERSGDPMAARASYRRAARRTLSLPEQRYLESRARRLAPS
jgi:RNA polymerase sigma factor (sigma-70 family)